MPHRFSTVECVTFSSSTECPIRLRYADLPGGLTSIDFADGNLDCHLVQIQPTADGSSMEVHFTGCPCMMLDLREALDLQDIENESRLLCPFSGEYRQAGLVFGVVHERLDEDQVRQRFERIGRPVELEHKPPVPLMVG